MSSIKLRCEHCGAGISAPREMAGKMSKCPSCGNTLYVPTPENEIEELPLTPEDDSDVRREQQLQEERRRLDKMIAGEERPPAEGADKTRGGSAEHKPGSQAGPAHAADGSAAGGTTRAQQALMRYLKALRDSDFDTAERALATLKMQPRTALELIDRLISDQLPPVELSDVPPGVYQGFLKTLRSKL